jgi:hypothetical protein
VHSPKTNRLEIESECAYVVYDLHNGAIVHVHRKTTFRGAKSLSQQQDEARAIQLAKQFGHRTEGLRVLRVDPRELEPRTPQRVDLASLKLAPGHHAERRH